MPDKEKDMEKLMELLQKKFADKALDMEELDEVSGGSDNECRADVEFLEGLLKDEGKKVLKGWNGRGEGFYRDYRKIENAWALVGIRFESNGSDKGLNGYYIAATGRKLTRKAAIGYAKLYWLTKDDPQE